MAMKKIFWMRIVPFLCVFLAVQARLVALPQEPPKEAKAQPAGWTPAEMMKVKSVGDVRVSPDGRRAVFTVTQPVMAGEKSEMVTHIHMANAYGSISFQFTYGHHRRSEEHTSELQSLAYLVCRLL